MKHTIQPPFHPASMLITTVALVALVAGLTLVGGCSRSDRSTRTLIQNKGSDTMVNLAQSWAEEYGKVTADVGVAVSGGGSGTGIAALINGTVDIANASRGIHTSERESVRKINGVEAIEHTVATDAVVFFLHPNNPATGLTIGQLACIYGEGGKCETWDALDITVPGCSGQKIIRVSRQSNSGTYVFIREAVLGATRDFKLGSHDMQGSKDVVDLVSKTPCSIGFSGLAYATEEIRMPCIAKDSSARCINPSIENARSGLYPLSRPLFMYTLGPPEGEVKKYLDWILSDAGQAITMARGFIPVN